MNYIEHLYDLYDENLSGRTLELAVKEIGGKRRSSYIVQFNPWNAKHLIGQDSEWHEQKVEAFSRMCYPSTWKMVGDYMDNMGDLLEADILVGGVNQVFAFREDGDGMLVPVSCLLLDIRDYVYDPIWKIEDVADI